MRVLQYFTTDCYIYRIWFKDKLIKYEHGTLAKKDYKHMAHSYLNMYLSGHTMGFKELSPEEIDDLKVSLL
jgi:hypothetical protein